MKSRRKDESSAAPGGGGEDGDERALGRAGKGEETGGEGRVRRCAGMLLLPLLLLLSVGEG